MKVVHVISGLDPRSGGPTIALFGLTKALVKTGTRVEVVGTVRSDPAADTAMVSELRSHGVDVKAIGPARGLLSRHPRIRPTLQAALAGADIVHIHALWEEVQHRAARLAYRAGVPYVLSPHGMLDPWSLTQGRLKKRLYLMWRLRKNLDRAAAIHFTSTTERDVVAPLRLRPPTIVVPNGIDLTEFEQLPPKGTFRARYPQIGDRLVVLFLSRVHPGKGLDLLVPAFARADTRGAMLVIAGPGEATYLSQVQQWVRENGLTDRTIFTGMLYGPERVAALADADLFVLPSDHENFGIAVVEALAARTPVIISDQVNIHDQITAAGVGQVVPTRVEDLSSQLTRWLGDPVLRAAAAERARPFVWQHYDWQQIARRWVEHYSRLSSSAGRREDGWGRA